MPLTSSEEQKQYRTRWANYFAQCRVDWAAVADECEEMAWYVARYGHQDFDTVCGWTRSKVRRAAKYLNKFIKAEAPKTSPGAS